MRSDCGRFAFGVDYVEEGSDDLTVVAVIHVASRVVQYLYWNKKGEAVDRSTEYKPFNEGYLKHREVIDSTVAALEEPVHRDESGRIKTVVICPQHLRDIRACQPSCLAAVESLAAGSPIVQATCRHGDPTCPCQDGDPCHYEGEDPMPCSDHEPHTGPACSPRSGSSTSKAPTGEGEGQEGPRWPGY